MSIFSTPSRKIKNPIFGFLFIHLFFLLLYMHIPDQHKEMQPFEYPGDALLVQGEVHPGTEEMLHRAVQHRDMQGVG